MCACMYLFHAIYEMAIEIIACFFVFFFVFSYCSEGSVLLIGVSLLSDEELRK